MDKFGTIIVKTVEKKMRNMFQLSIKVISGVRVAHSLVFCVLVCRQLLVLFPLFLLVDHCVVCPCSIYATDSQTPFSQFFSVSNEN